MLSKDSTRTELGKRPIPTRGQGDNLNTITYRRSLLSKKPNSYHRGNRNDKREDNLVGHSLFVVRLLWQHPGGLEPGLRQTSHGETRAALRPPFLSFSLPPSLPHAGSAVAILRRTSHCGETARFLPPFFWRSTTPPSIMYKNWQPAQRRGCEEKKNGVDFPGSSLVTGQCFWFTSEEKASVDVDDGVLITSTWNPGHEVFLLFSYQLMCASLIFCSEKSDKDSVCVS